MGLVIRTQKQITKFDLSKEIFIYIYLIMNK